MPVKTKQKEIKKIPKLRFSGFFGEWEDKRLGEAELKIIDGDRGKNYPNGNDFSDDEYCLFLNAGNVTKNGFLFNKNTFITKEKDNSLSKGKLKRLDVVLTTRGSVGHIAYYNKDVAFDNIRINSGMVLVRNKNKNIDSNFIFKFLSSAKIKNKILRTSSGSAQPQLTVKDIVRIKLSFPSLKEQQKIAEFLTCVDEWIENLRAQKESLEDYKKGMMQKIFSREVRFKRDDEGEFGEWEEKKLEDVAKTTTGESNREDSTEEGKFAFFDRSSDIRASSKYLYNAEALIVPGEGQVFIPRYFKGKFDLHQRTYAIMNFHGVNALFLFYYMIFNKNYFNRVAVGTTVPSLRLPMFNNMPLHIPSNDEQQKIAEFLTSLDNLIESKQQQITQAEEWKKGLMQELFV